MMHSIPDGVEVVADWADAQPAEQQPLLVLDPVTQFLDTHNIGHGPLS
jgi:hypothetical protein